MFISNQEKYELRVAIRTLQAQVLHLMEKMEKVEAVKTVEKVKTPKPKRRKPVRTVPLLKTEEAPWGYKKDGTPRASPGRKSPVETEGQNEKPVSV